MNKQSTMTEPNPRDLYRYSTLAPILPDPTALDEAQVAAYHRDGFLAMEHLLSMEEVETAKAALSDLIYGRVPDYTGVSPEAEYREQWDTMTPEERAHVVRRVIFFVEHEKRLQVLALGQKINGVLERLMGEPCHLIQDMALLKPPFVGREKPWHQDMAYFAWGPPEKIIGVWIALDAATAENGCMHVVPGTHQAGPVPHVHKRDCQLPDERVDVEHDVIVPLAPGGALFFSSLVHHGTPPNNSPQGRWALQFHYAAQSAYTIDRSQHQELYHEDEQYAGCRFRNAK